MKKIKGKLIDFLYLEGPFILMILLISLIPLLWYEKGSIALGHDMGWSFVPIDRFIDRLYTWTRTGFGVDQSLDLGVASIYGMQAALSALGLSVLSVQKVTFIFWFFVMGSSMYYFTRSVYKGKYSRALGLLAATFYMLNHYTLQAWGVAELSKFSIMTFTPILLAT